jgi:hypothetical protein
LKENAGKIVLEMKDPNAYATLEFNKTENANASISANFETFQKLQLKACLMPSGTKKTGRTSVGTFS